jgi:hypothetical protein
MPLLQLVPALVIIGAMIWGFNLAGRWVKTVPMQMLLGLLLASSAFADGLKWEGTTQRIEVRPGEQAIHTQFPYRNAGKSPVRIESVRGVCVCCTSAYATKKKLSPGESGAVVVRVDFEKKPLPLVKPVTVKTDDGQTTVLIVEVYPKP